MTEVRAAARQAAPDPDDAERRVEHYLDAARLAGLEPLPADHAGDALEVLSLACQRAPYLARLLARMPERLYRVSADPYLRREKPAAVMAAELGRLVADCPADEPESLSRALRTYRGDELVRLGARELELGLPGEVGRELAHLADVCFDAAIAFHDRALRARWGAPRYTGDDGTERDCELVVIGMGKLGGEELNFTSDVDVIYVYSSDNGGVERPDGSVAELSLHEYYSKLCKLVTTALAEVTELDAVFRVDLRLRPEGSRGAIANSLPSTERYYEAWGRPWERQAWLKARPCAGSMALGEQVMTTLHPFVYPRATSPRVVDEVHELNRRIKAELDSAGVDSGFDVKNGVGGIREIEFFVQALQLIHAGRNPGLRSPTTMIALDQLLFAGLITESEHRTLGAAYRFLRRTEHLLQLDSGRQTQRLPVDPDAVALVARRLGYAGAPALLAALGEHTGEVARLFSTLGEPEEGPGPEIQRLLLGNLEPAEEIAALAELGFRDPAGAHAELQRARKKPLSPLGTSATGTAARVAAEVLSELRSCPDPDQALRYMSELISRRGTWSAVWGLLGSNPALLRLLVSLFGTSEFLAKSFVSHPELIDLLVQTGRADAHRTPDELERLLAGRFAEVDPDDEEGRWNALAELKNAQLLRIGMGDVAGELDHAQVCVELSRVAELCLAHAFDLVEAQILARHGIAREADGSPAKLTVLALGKLGGRELGYASDLDLIFVYTGDGTSDGARRLDNVTYMTRLAQRLMSGLHAMHPGGRLYEVDTRLRPSGSAGLLVSSLSGWDKYHAGQARLWERQALTKLRCVAGDRALGARVEASAAQFVYGRAPGSEGSPDREALASAVIAMRERIERELGGSRDLKTGRGGLVDIEFASQYLQLAFGHQHPALRTTSTVQALEAAAACGVADAADCTLLIDGYAFLRTLEHRMRIVHDRSVHKLPDDPVELDKLARRAGHADGAELSEHFGRWCTDIRAAYQRILAHAR